MASFTGTSGDDTLIGTTAADMFDLSKGGEDKASGKAGDDIFRFGAAFDAGDAIDGGGGHDVVQLNGDYAAGVVIGATTLVGIEEIDLAAGHGYALSGLTDANAAAGLTIDAHHLADGDNTVIDASGYGLALTYLGGAGADEVLFGAGRDIVQGGGGDDMLIAASSFNKQDRIDGGDGFDNLVVQGGKLTLTGHDAGGVEELRIMGAGTVKAHDDFVAAGQTMQVQALGGPVSFDGSHETDGAYFIDGGDGADRLIGSAGDDIMRAGGGDGGDTLFGGAGSDNLSDTQSDGAADVAMSGDAGNDGLFGNNDGDTLNGGDGDDVLDATGRATLNGGLGSDRLIGVDGDTYVFKSIAEAMVSMPDSIDALTAGSVIDLHGIDADTTTKGDQAFHLVEAFTGHAGELSMLYSASSNSTTLAGDVNGDGSSDFLILLHGDQTGFTNFIL